MQISNKLTMNVTPIDKRTFGMYNKIHKKNKYLF